MNNTTFASLIELFLFTTIKSKTNRYRLSPIKLFLCQLIWIPAYLLVANYFERSLLPFRLICYTQSSLLTTTTSKLSTTASCIDLLFGPEFVKNPKNCMFNQIYKNRYEPKFINTDTHRIAIVRSAPQSVDYRQFIRETWKSSLNMPLIFVLGHSSDHIEQYIEQESITYDDILLSDMHDAYHNLTLKMIVAYRYVLEKYPKLQQILVLNDDVIVNSTSLHRIMNEFDNSSSTSYIIGKVSRGYPRLFFLWNSHFYVSNGQYPHRCYPPFVQGSSFVVSRMAAQLIVDRICHFPYVYLDDVMMGIVFHCSPIDMHHRDGFDRYLPDRFVVFHYQWSRYLPDQLRQLWVRQMQNGTLLE